MKEIENAVAKHYGDADLLTRILAGLEASGIDRNALRPEDLAPVDELHIGGRKATAHAVAKMSLNEKQHVLDVGCGVGGAMRYIAAEIGCRVTGIDLTPEYISTAKKLTELTGLENKATHEVASALNMPFENGTFDAAITIHVAMNIADRKALYTEVARVLKPNATFCIYDVMKKNDENLIFPVPWAESEATSHLTTPEEMRALLDDAGFEIREVEDRTEIAVDFFRQAAASATAGPPALGIHLVLGASAREKLKNTRDNIEKGRIGPVLIIASRK